MAQSKISGVLDQLLGAGRDLYARGEDYAAGQLGVGDDAKSRETMRNTALAGGGAAAVLGLLLGTKTGRGLATTGAVVGGLGYLGKLAYDAYQKNYGASAAAQEAPPVGQLEGAAADDRARAILVAMIAAAKADGHIDERENALIREKIDEMGPDASAIMLDALGRPADAETVAAGAGTDQARREIYAVSVLVCEADHPDERSYLDRLAAAMGVPAEVARDIEMSLRAG